MKKYIQYPSLNPNIYWLIGHFQVLNEQGAGPRPKNHHIYINCWLPVYRWSVMDKQVTSTPQYLEMGGGGVLVTCIYITDHL